MLKKINWRTDTVISLRLRDDLFSLCQMRCNSIMQFFACCNTDNEWGSTKLDDIRTVACLFVAESRIKSLFENVPVDVIPARSEIPRLMLNAIIGGPNQLGASLVELNDAYSMTGERMIKSRLDPVADYETICTRELTGMQGNAERLRSRLLRYFDTGINWDDQKSFLFKGIKLPAPDFDWKPCRG